ncbi:MAG: DoxX family protein [Burkholderiales bacterium]|jgi:putative oxidoreductase|nr:DoxX family protein [Burkholderiales bacterium]
MNTTSKSLIAKLWTLSERGIHGLNALQPAAQLIARLYVASVFFRSGLTKIQDFDTTIALFMDEYHVPLLNPTVAAYMGTAAELALPVLLVLGLGGRFAAAGLFIVNAVAVISLTDVAPAAFQQHIFWGSLLAALLLWGPGRWSIDCFTAPWLRARVLGGHSTGGRHTQTA